MSYTNEDTLNLSRNEQQNHDDLIGESSTCPICYETYRSKLASNVGRFDEIPISSPTCLSDKGTRPHPQERIGIPDCDHQFCRDCLKRHCQHAISIRKIPIECPFRASDCCKVIVPVSLIRALLLQQSISEMKATSNILPLKEEKGDSSQNSALDLVPMPNYDDSSSLSNLYGSLDKDDDATRSVSDPPPEYQQELQDWLAFQRMYRLFLDETLTPCTSCQEPVPTQLVSESQKEREHEIHPSRGGTLKSKRSFAPIVCLSCGHSFCQVHGDAHPNMSCEEYLKQERCRPNEQSRKSERVIQQYCKPCSHCQAPIQKESGCDHIICPSCHQDMCFKCGTHQYLYGKSMVRNCRNCDQSFIDHRYIGRYRLIMCLALLLYLPFYTLYVIVVGAFALISCGCCFCLVCGIQNKRPGKKHQEVCVSIKTKTIVEEDFEFRPKIGVQTVLWMIFMPFVDLFQQCGISCWCALQENHFEDDSDDEELQLRPNLTMATALDVDASSEE
jgi:hypothetical protein